MKKPSRVLDLTYYEWSILRWMTSDTRNLLDATGIGIYRELLDRCYAQGTIPVEPQLQATIAKCTSEQLAVVWPLIKANFRIVKGKPNRLENTAATVYRSNNFRFRDGQVRSGANGGRAKANKVKDISRQPTRLLEKPTSHLPTNLLTNLHTAAPHADVEVTPAQIAALSEHPPTHGEWLLLGVAIEEHFDSVEYPFLLKLINAAVGALAQVANPKILLTDEIMARAVRHCYRPSQSSAGLFLNTVPPCIKSWALNGVRSRDSPVREPDTISQVSVWRKEQAERLARGEEC